MWSLERGAVKGANAPHPKKSTIFFYLIINIEFNIYITIKSYKTH